MLDNKKIALITGASRGIGKAIALKLAQQKDIFVIGTATSEIGAQNISEMFATNNFAGKGFVLNFNKETSIDSFYKEISEQYKVIDILINNAGITRDNLSIRMKNEEWDDVINVNLTSVFKLTQLFLKTMIKQRWGRVINISSVVAFTGNFGQCNYVAAKSGVIGLTRSLALEVANRNITVNAVAPGFIATDMTDKLSEEQKAKILEKIPMKRMGSPDDIASAVSFLLSEGASYISGETIHVNGGMYMI